MRSDHSVDVVPHNFQPQQQPESLNDISGSSLENAAQPTQTVFSLAAVRPLNPSDTGMEFLAVYRRLLAEIECWCKPTGAPITQVIRWQALRDYVEVYSLTYPRQPSYPFPPRFGRYAAYLDGFDNIVEAIDAWCEWLGSQFLPGVVPIHLLQSALAEWDETQRAPGRAPSQSVQYMMAPLATAVGEAA